MENMNNNQANVNRKKFSIVKKKAKKLGIKQEDLSIHFKIAQSEISKALNGYRPELLKEIESYINEYSKKYETPQNENTN